MISGEANRRQFILHASNLTAARDFSKLSAWSEEEVSTTRDNLSFDRLFFYSLSFLNGVGGGLVGELYRGKMQIHYLSTVCPIEIQPKK